MVDRSRAQKKPKTGDHFNWHRPSSYPWLVFGLSGLFGFLLGFTWRVSVITKHAEFFATSFFSFLALLVITIQARIYSRQREIMEGQLKVAGNQSMILNNQAEISRGQKEVLTKQHEAMIDQLKIMEGALKATRDSVDLAWEGLKTQKRAYLGTNRMNIDLTARKRLAIYLTNIGKSPATSVRAKLQITISTPVDWHKAPPPKNVRIFALGEEEYKFNLTAIYPDSIPVRIGFPLGKHFTDEELTLVVQKKSRLTVNLSLDYQDGFDDGFAYFVLTYRGKDSHGHDSWGIFPTESEKEYDQANPDL